MAEAVDEVLSGKTVLNRNRMILNNHSTQRKRPYKHILQARKLRSRKVTELMGEGARREEQTA